MQAFTISPWALSGRRASRPLVLKEKAFTLYSLYDATKEFLAEKTSSGDGGFDELSMSEIECHKQIDGLISDLQKLKIKASRKFRKQN